MLGHRVNSEGLRGRANAPWRRRTQEDLYRVHLPFLSTIASRKTPKKAAIFAGFCHLPAGLSGGSARLAQDVGSAANSPLRRGVSRGIVSHAGSTPPLAGLGRTWATFLGRLFAQSVGCREQGVSDSIT